MKFGKDFLNLPDTSHLNALKLINSQTKKSHIIENAPGKQASVKIFYGISRQDKNIITLAEAKYGLDLYGDYVQEELRKPNSHPNIRLLLEIIEHKQTWIVSLL